jgi:hypothetical protein
MSNQSTYYYKGACIVPKCKNISNESTGLHFFQLPSKNAKRKMEWVHAMRLPKATIVYANASRYVCADHFDVSIDYHHNNDNRKDG